VGEVPMVRIRNPWGDSHEWKGAWSDGYETLFTKYKAEIEIIYKYYYRNTYCTQNKICIDQFIDFIDYFLQ